MPHRGFADAVLRKINQAARAEVFHERQAAPLAESHELFKRRLIGKASDLEIRRVHAEQGACLFVDGVFVVREVRAIGRPDFAKDRAALLHNLGDSKAIANFDELSSRDNHFALASQRRQSDEHGRSAIVDHNGGFRARQSRQQLGGMHIALAPRASFEVVFEIAVLRGAATEFVHHCFRQWRAAQVRVQNHSGSVDDRLQRARKNSFDFVGDKFFDGGGAEAQRCPIRIAHNARSQIRKHRPGNFDYEVAVHAFRKRRQPRLSEQFVHRRNLPQQFRLLRRNRLFAPLLHSNPPARSNISAQCGAPGNAGVFPGREETAPGKTIEPAP